MEFQARRRGRFLAPRRTTRTAVTALLFAFGSVALAGCLPAAAGTHRTRGSASAKLRRSAVKPPALFGVGLGLVTWDDTDASTENFYTGTTTPGRIIKVEILYPSLAVKAPNLRTLATPALRFGPYPVVVFAHGYDVDPGTYRALLVSWAEAGFVVVAPFFPDTSRPAVAAQHGVDTEGDIFNQPADVAFVVSQVVKAADRSPSTRIGYLDGMMNPARIILAGQSDGGASVAALMYDHAYAAVRASMAAKPVAVALLSADEFLRAVDSYSAPSGGGPPVLVVQSLTDACNDPANSALLYNMLKGSTKWFLAIDNATHLGPYAGLGAAASVVEQATVAFFDLAIAKPKASPSVLHQKGERPGLSTITSAASVPLFPAPAPSPGACALPSGAPTN
ncbi:MAG: hypothetical protein ABSG36_08530 [Acidimicrobiales bacterium]